MLHKYNTKRLIRSLVRRQIIIYNHIHGLNNTNALRRYNHGFTFTLNDTAFDINGIDIKHSMNISNRINCMIELNEQVQQKRPSTRLSIDFCMMMDEYSP